MNKINQGLLMLTAPRSLEEELVDFFFDHNHQQGFTSLHVRGHSSNHDKLSPIEQVTGRQNNVQFQVLVNASEAQVICQRLESAFTGIGIHYWFIPSALQGHI